MKVLFYQPWMKSKGGIERLVLEYAERSDHDVTVVTHYLEEGFEDYSAEIISLTDKKVPEGFLKRGLFSAPRIMKEKLDLDEYDVLLVSEAGLGSFITFRNHSIPVICYCHTPLRAAHQFYSFYKDRYGFFGKKLFTVAASIYRFFEKRAWKHFDHVVANSGNTSSNILEAGLKSEKNISVVHPGADTSNFAKEEDEKYFFYPSRYKQYKRHLLAIEAFNKFNKKIGGYKLVLAGFPDDEEYLSEVKKAAGENVEVLSNVSDSKLRDLYSGCTGVLFTAKNEDWGIVPVEAMASGKPVVAVDEGGPTESVVEGETGFLVPDNSDGIAEKMVELISDSERYEEMCLNCLERAEKFSWNAFVEKLDSELEKKVKEG